MAETDAVQHVFAPLDEAITTLSDDLKVSYLEALPEELANLNANEVHVENGAPAPGTVAKLTPLAAQFSQAKATAGLTAAQTAIQLAIVKGMRAAKTDANQMITPEAIGTLVATTADVILHGAPSATILDPSVGTGNLLLTVMRQLPKPTDEQRHGYGVDNNEDLLAIADAFARQLGETVDWFHQDGIAPLVVPAVDLVVNEPPVGYYPLDDVAKDFATHASTGHSFAHHLFIEQGMHYVKDGGFGFFIVPTAIFNTKEAHSLTAWMAQQTYIQALLELPKQLFQDEKVEKSILVLQKHGGAAQQAKQILLAGIPDPTDRRGIAEFFHHVQDWRKENIKTNSK
ncbi:class I SAM-dependent methyltransferase [Schleiferilactobacillus shenzhenensis]|uniref:Site-specific DNA-methyltransferase (Adenine-specific) n=1 Tax=Schleiferilactobacillus shenzhenensis LY-73 TaxID=1231336 RepID=U4TGS4_9LACO|nr:class I SAM-dependent methyltransferase [Schleiferilactobacillus shenzhenensis]ERL63986.1 site-specific DNA-methyltransferase (adenine-specific) [Schleiferilactobacillus shenzhenensis LY-73]